MGSDIRVRVATLCALAALVAGVVAGCGSSGTPSPAGSASSSSGSASRSASASASTSSPSFAASCDVGPWHSAPVTVTRHVAAPPVPIVTAVQVAQHPECGYDRVVVDIHGPIPGYSVRYVDHVIADASGKTITIPGSSFLLVVLQPAQAHNNAGVPTVTSGVRTPGYPALASWALAGDFEGYVRIALGLSGHVSIRTGELGGRIYIDLKE